MVEAVIFIGKLGFGRQIEDIHHLRTRYVYSNALTQLIAMVFSSVMND